MTYAVGGTIQASDYNGFATTLNNVWGTGSGSRGWGQSSPVGTVTATVDTVTAAQWNSLISRMDTMRRHQANVTTGLGSRSAGSAISYDVNISSNVTVVDNNRFGNYAWSSTVTNNITNATSWSGQPGSIKEGSIAFGSAAAMRYFFNSGGAIQMSLASSSLNIASNSKTADWDALLDNFGYWDVFPTSSVKESQTGTLNVYNTGLGFWAGVDTGLSASTSALTSTYQVFGRQYSTNAVGGYTSNYVQLEVRLNANANSGTATTFYYKFSLIDAAADNSIPASADSVVGTVTSSATVYFPELGYIANTWGAITHATVTNTQV